MQKETSFLLVHAAQLATPTGTAARRGPEMGRLRVWEDGAVLVQDGVIQAVGTTQELRPYGAGLPQIDATGMTVLPGFVDSHTHLVFGGFRQEEYRWRLQGDSYLSIMARGGGINRTVERTRASTKAELKAQAARFAMEMLRMGVTTLEAKSGYGLDTETELKQLEVLKELDQALPLDVVPTFLGPHSVLPAYKGREEAFLDEMAQKVAPLVREKHLATFADIFCEANVFSVEQSRNYLLRLRDMGFLLKVHADEMTPLGGAEMAAALGAVSADHLLKISPAGIAAMARCQTVCTLLPATAFCLQEAYPPARKLIDAGCAVALASDFNPGSCFTCSVPLLIALSTIYMKMTVEEVVTALTLNGAAALRRADRTGSLEPGKQADLLLMAFPSVDFLPYYTAMNQVHTVIKNGRVVFSKGPVVAP